MQNKKVSVIVPIYNAEKFLERTLNSIINQTYKNLQIILVNDGSKDSSAEICNKYAKKDSRIVVIHKQNEGVSEARNDGLKIATGEYVEFVDSDDYLDENSIEVLVQKIEDCDLVICGYYIHNKKTVENCKFDDEDIDDYKTKSDKFMQIVKSALFSSLWNKLYRRELITSNFDKSYFIGEDVIFNMKYLQNCNKIATIREQLYHYNFENSESIIHTKIRDEETFTKYWMEIYHLFQKYFKDKKFIPLLNGLFIKATMSQVINITLKKRLKYKEYKRIFDLYRNLPQTREAFKEYDGNVFNKVNFIRKMAIVIFKFRFKFLFSIIVKLYGRAKQLN